VALLVAAACGLSACSKLSPDPVSVAAADNYTVAWNGERLLTVLDNDITRDGTSTLSVAVAPTNGSVTASNGALNYTPRPGFFGEDSFTYKLDVDSASSTAVVKLVVEAQLTLQGVVTDGPIANAKVVAAVGSASFSVDADAQGPYALPIKTSRPGDFVVLTATGVGAQSKVVLTSVVGEVAGLAAASTANRVTADRAPALMVTHLSAAQAGLMVQAGKLPSSNAELLAAGQKIDSDAVLDAAALVKLVVDNNVALPAGAATTRDMLNSATVLTAFVDARQLADAPQLAAARRHARRCGFGRSATGTSHTRWCADYPAVRTWQRRCSQQICNFADAARRRHRD
jgi:hypothetical protein